MKLSLLAIANLLWSAGDKLAGVGPNECATCGDYAIGKAIMPLGEDGPNDWLKRCRKCGYPRGTLAHGARCMAGLCDDPDAVKPQTPLEAIINNPRASSSIGIEQTPPLCNKCGEAYVSIPRMGIGHLCGVAGPPSVKR